jgi:hypothetical protein
MKAIDILLSEYNNAKDTNLIFELL